MAGRLFSSSNRKLLLLLAVAVLPPVLLVLGPFRKQFFPHDVAALQALAILERPQLDLVALAGPKWNDDPLFAELKRQWEEGRYDALADRLERVADAQMTPGMKFLQGQAFLLARLPARAIPGLEAARREGDPALKDRALEREATFALAQALLLMGRRVEARAELEKIAPDELEKIAPAGAGALPHAKEIQEQIAALDALR